MRAAVSYAQLVDLKVYGARNHPDADICNSTAFKKGEILLLGRNVRLFLTAQF